MTSPEAEPISPESPEPVPPQPWLEELPPRQIVAELDRYIVGQDAGQEGRRDRDPQPLAPGAGARRDPRRDHPQQHHPDRPHRRRQDRDRPPPGPAGRRAVRQGRSLEVHRGGLRRARRRVDGARPGGRRDQHGAHRAGGRGLSAGRAAGRGAAARPPAAAPDAAPHRTPRSASRAGSRSPRRLRGRVPASAAPQEDQPRAKSARRRTREKLRAACCKDGKLEEREVEIEVTAAELPDARHDAAAAGHGGSRTSTSPRCCRR